MEQIRFFKQTESTDWKWKLSDLGNVKKNGKKVFSCFAGGGGSTMGYKLAGYDVIGNCEIDKRMNDVYITNHHPKYNYLMDIRDFNKLIDLPDELYNLDILDGSPPCTTFSIAGQREETWGKEKKFREGQVMQVLDDLSFVFIETVMKLKPKVVIMENVEGILLGNAWQYVQTIYKMFEEIGYHVNHYLLKSEYMGVPQARHRVFFIANRIGEKEIDMTFNYKPITYKEIKDGQGRSLSKNCKTYKLLCDARQGEKDLSRAHQRLYGKRSFFQSKILYDNDVVLTIRAKSNDFFSYEDKKGMSKNDIIHSQTFPEDYKFIPDTYNNICYVCGMSVPPVMIKRIAERIYSEWLIK